MVEFSIDRAKSFHCLINTIIPQLFTRQLSLPPKRVGDRYSVKGEPCVIFRETVNKVDTVDPVVLVVRFKLGLKAVHDDGHIKNLRRIKTKGKKAFLEGKRDW